MLASSSSSDPKLECVTFSIVIHNCYKCLRKGLGLCTNEMYWAYVHM